MSDDKKDRNRTFQDRKRTLAHLMALKSSGSISTDENELLIKLIECVNDSYCLVCDQDHFDNCLVREYQTEQVLKETN